MLGTAVSVLEAECPRFAVARRGLARTLLFYCAALLNTVRKWVRRSRNLVASGRVRRDMSCGTGRQRGSKSAAKPAATWLTPLSDTSPNGEGVRPGWEPRPSGGCGPALRPDRGRPEPSGQCDVPAAGGPPEARPAAAA